MFTLGLRTTIILEIDFCYLYRAMSHFTRELEDLTTALKVEFRKGMTKGKSQIVVTYQRLNPRYQPPQQPVMSQQPPSLPSGIPTGQQIRIFRS